MTPFINCCLDYSWKIATFYAPALILPLPPRDSLICHTVFKLTYKVQERVFKHFFPAKVNFLNISSSPIFPSRFEILNSTLSTMLSFVMLRQIGRTSLARTMLIYRLYMLTIIPTIFIGSVITFIIAMKLYFRARSYLYPIAMPKILITEDNVRKADEIRDLIEKIQEKDPHIDIDMKLREKCPDLEEQVLQGIAFFPIREKGNPKHFWDKETIASLIKVAQEKAKPPNCPNGCNKELRLEETVSTELQDKIIEFLTNLYQEI